MREQNQQNKKLKSATNIISELQERIDRHTLTEADEQKIRKQIAKEDAELAAKALDADRNHQLNKIFSNSMIN
ncbi:ATP-binding protein, partial [Listeria monocytogenes]|nr:ATP-binding protein [Listeria monocytogenes]